MDGKDRQSDRERGRASKLESEQARQKGDAQGCTRRQRATNVGVRATTVSEADTLSWL